MSDKNKYEIIDMYDFVNCETYEKLRDNYIESEVRLYKDKTYEIILFKKCYYPERTSQLCHRMSENELKNVNFRNLKSILVSSMMEKLLKNF